MKIFKKMYGYKKKYVYLMFYDISHMYWNVLTVLYLDHNKSDEDFAIYFLFSSISNIIFFYPKIIIFIADLLSIHEVTAWWLYVLSNSIAIKKESLDEAKSCLIIIYLYMNIIMLSYTHFNKQLISFYYITNVNNI